MTKEFGRLIRLMKDLSVSKTFEITFNDLTLNFELFNIDYIFDELKNLKNVDSIHRIIIPEKKTFSSLKKFCIDNETKCNYFTYIKFFKCENEIYGLVGGKTNYQQPDIKFDYLNNLENKKDNRISRHFLKATQYNWSDEIIIVNHKSVNDNNKDNQQALFLECYLQRQFNLFNS